MSIAGITGSNFLQSYNPQNLQSKFQQIQTQFQQLGQDLQAGNLSQAQADFATLSQQLPIAQQQNDASSVAQGFQALAKDLQAGTCRRPNKISLTSNKRRSKPPGKRPIATTGTMQAQINSKTIPFRNLSKPWARPCNPEISLRRSKHMQRCSKTCSRSHCGRLPRAPVYREPYRQLMLPEHPPAHP